MNDSISSSSLNVRDFTTLGVSVDDQTPKHLEFDFENMSSMTSQSTGQFCRDLAFAEGSRTNGGSVSDQSAFREVHMEPLEIVVHSMPSMGSQDTPFHPSFIDYGMRLPMFPYQPQVVQSLQLHYAEPYFGGAIPAVPRSMLLGVGPMRMQLPQDCPYDTPVYVNAKQYHTILRRRQVRSRLMAQNKIPNCRKPYIHESRHLHAVKRPRGSSGRFLNTKKAEEEESKTIPNNTIDQPCQGGTEPEFSQVHHMENVKDAPCTTPSGSSDVTSTSNSGDAFQPPDHEVSNNPSDIGNSTGGMQNQHQLMEVHN